MTTERLGLEPGSGKAVWVLWVDAPMETALAALADMQPCPECQGPWNLARARGVKVCVAESVNCNSVSDRCPACQARLHLDTTPLADRAALRWPKVAVGLSPVTPSAALSVSAANIIAAAVLGPKGYR